MNPNPKLKENSHFILKGMPNLSLSYRYQIRIQNKFCSSLICTKMMIVLTPLFGGDWGWAEWRSGQKGTSLI